MLPLEGIFFIPSLIVTPVAVAALFFLRKRSSNYSYLWRSGVVVCAVLCALFLVQALNTPLYSERDKSPDNPGGFSTGPLAVVAIMILETCVIIPAFPVLIGLALLPPSNWHVRSRLLMVAFCLLYVGLLGWAIAAKNAQLVADYQSSKLQERQQGDQFQHVRRP